MTLDKINALRALAPLPRAPFPGYHAPSPARRPPRSSRRHSNLTSDGVNLYTWNARNQLLAITGPGLTATFSYDALGRRQSRAVNGASTQALYDGLTPIQKAGTTGIPTLLTGLGIDEHLTRTDAAGARTLVTDALGSTVALTDAAGIVQTQYTYEPFGATAATGPTDANPLPVHGPGERRHGPLLLPGAVLPSDAPAIHQRGSSRSCWYLDYCKIAFRDANLPSCYLCVLSVGFMINFKISLVPKVRALIKIPITATA